MLKYLLFVQELKCEENSIDLQKTDFISKPLKPFILHVPKIEHTPLFTFSMSSYTVMCQLMEHPTYGTFFKIFMTILYTNILKPHPTYGTFLEKLMTKRCPISWNMTVYHSPRIFSRQL